MANVATLEEIERHWSIIDIFEANEVLDIKDEYEDAFATKMDNEIKSKRP